MPEMKVTVGSYGLFTIVLKSCLDLNPDSLLIFQTLEKRWLYAQYPHRQNGEDGDTAIEHLWDEPHKMLPP